MNLCRFMSGTVIKSGNRLQDGSFGSFTVCLTGVPVASCGSSPARATAFRFDRTHINRATFYGEFPVIPTQGSSRYEALGRTPGQVRPLRQLQRLGQGAHPPGPGAPGKDRATGVRGHSGVRADPQRPKTDLTANHSSRCSRREQRCENHGIHETLAGVCVDKFETMVGLGSLVSA
jgi:hypothetical protein